MEETLATPDTTRRSLSPSCSAAVKSRAAGFERRTKRRLSETNASVREDREEEEEEEDEVKEKIEALQRIIPGGTALGVDALFEETAGYIMSLQCQIKTIKVLTSFLQRVDQEDMKFGDETVAEVAELKKVLMDKGESFESLRKVRGEIEKRVRDLDWRTGVLEVKEVEEKSKNLRVEEDFRGIDVGELGNCRSEKNFTEEALSESQKMAMEMELNKVEEAKKTLALLNERNLEPTNGVRATKDVACMVMERFTWMENYSGSGCCWFSWSCWFGGSDIVRMLFKTNVIW
ncbi:unnamed protein product [Arabidopsis arenosa]|uniref:Uncharacterized protein n=1 Tax=Arabidopsis arenosa TaxID=38785 RepID=A0A8S2ADF4_ARAAE|nr:unnamed protein product [Arabidopsis arenosa]